MQTDEEVGKVAQAVPVIISRTLELFVESLLTKTLRITNARNAKTLSPSHMKQCIISESRFDFLRDLVKNIPDIGVNEEQHSGSEAGYGNEAGASPASTSTSSSSNGGAATGILGSGDTSCTVTGLLQRSESYTPGSSSSYASAFSSSHHSTQPQSQQQQSQPQANSLKRTFNPSNSLNFYKEISLEDSSSTSSNKEPPPKLSRLLSAPAATAATTTNSIPIKIDILPNLPKPAPSHPSSTSTSSNNNLHQTKTNNGGGTASDNNNLKITYKIAATGIPATSTAIEQPVIKLDYSDLKLPMTVDGGAAEQAKQSYSASRQHQAPTIKIDLSNISNYRSPAKSQSSPVTLTTGVKQQQVPSTASTPSTPLSAMSIASSSSSCSSNSSKNPYVFQQQSSSQGSSILAVPPASVNAASSSSVPAAPLYSSVSSTIPGMDEDYDDI